MKKSGRWDSNPRPSPWQGDVLPLNYTRIRTTMIDIDARDYTLNQGFWQIHGRNLRVFYVPFTQSLRTTGLH